MHVFGSPTCCCRLAAMAGRTLAGLLAALLVALMRAPVASADGGSDSKEGAKVVELSAETFDSSVRNGSAGPWFVKFYAPWCGHCTRLAPKWAELAERLQGNVTLAKVDATVEKELAERWAVEGYPTLILIAEGSGYVYEGARSLEALEAYALGGYSKGPSSPPEPQDEEEEEANSDSVKLTRITIDSSVRAGGSQPWFLNFHIPTCGHCKSLGPAWEELARDLKGKVNVAKVNVLRDRALAERWAVDRFPTLRLVVGETVYDYEGERQAAALRDFALGGYRSARALALPEPLAPPAPTLLEEVVARQHMIVAFFGGIAFAGLVSVAWVRVSARGEEQGALGEKAPAVAKKEQ